MCQAVFGDEGAAVNKAERNPSSHDMQMHRRMLWPTYEIHAVPEWLKGDGCHGTAEEGNGFGNGRGLHFK
jgi:hypothetical protein